MRCPQECSGEDHFPKETGFPVKILLFSSVVLRNVINHFSKNINHFIQIKFKSKAYIDSEVSVEA